MNYTPKKGDLVGVDLVGYRQPDGTLKFGGDSEDIVYLKKFPDTVKVCGCVYTLEGVTKAKTGNMETGIYV